MELRSPSPARGIFSLLSFQSNYESILFIIIGLIKIFDYIVSVVLFLIVLFLYLGLLVDGCCYW